MNANELRIGNKLKKDNGEIYTVLRIDNTNDILVEEQRGLLTLDYNLFGIPLTEEWLLKFGAIKNNDWYDIRIFGLNFVEKRMVSKVNNYYNQYKLPEYVHQFQNLIFVLSGEELQLKS